MSMIRVTSIFVGVLGMLITTWCPAQDSRTHADLVLQGGRIATVDPELGEVDAIAIKGDRILKVGSILEIANLIGDETMVIELEGKRVIPGFIEGHAHFTGVGQAKMNLDLMNVRNWNEVIEMVAKAVRNAKPGEWIVGRGWHQEKWDSIPADSVEGFPTHHQLSEVSPDNPVHLTHASGHASFANRKAMELAGISGTSPDPEGGDILRDESGEPIGVFREKASGLISRANTGGGTSRRAQFERMDRMIQLASEECLKKGVTSFQDAGSGFATISILAEKAEAGELGVRLWMMIRESNERLKAHIGEAKHYRIGNNFLTVGGLKRSIDGALGSRGAWMLEDYEDKADWRGTETDPVAEVIETSRIAMENGLQMCAHAIGDRANREVLDIFEDYYTRFPDREDLRWRIEHSQHLHPDDIPRFGELGVIASMQGIHCTSDAPWVYKRLGEKRAEEGAYVWQKLMATGAIVTNGTDAPVEDIDPIASYYATVTRRTKDGSVFFPDQCMSRMEALKSYTINCAYAAFEEDIKGSLTPGKLADLVVLSKDILTCPADEIRDAQVLYTIVGGKIVYRK
ncbi:MAG: amidohydrolase [Planctomycetota bacterium]|nr:amidohydrolase [Planctomycetota bacterium]